MNISDYASIYSSQAAYSTTNVKGTASYFEVTGDLTGSKYAQGADSVDLSSTVQEMIDRAKSLDVFSCIFPNNNVNKATKSLDEVESDFMSDFSDFSSAFGKMSQMMGMGSGDSLSVGLNGTGGVNVSGNNEALNEKMSSMMNGNPTMVARYAVMAARASLADAGYTVDGFKEAYAQDPVKAIEDNIGALKERLLGFKTVASDGNMQYGFQREKEFEYSETTASYGTEAA